MSIYNSQLGSALNERLGVRNLRQADKHIASGRGRPRSAGNFPTARSSIRNQQMKRGCKHMNCAHVQFLLYEGAHAKDVGAAELHWQLSNHILRIPMITSHSETCRNALLTRWLLSCLSRQVFVPVSNFLHALGQRPKHLPTQQHPFGHTRIDVERHVNRHIIPSDLENP